MRYAQFFCLSTGYVPGSIPPRFDDDYKRPIPACGTDSVMYVDGRYSDERAIAEARAECNRRGFIGFTMNAGPSYMDSRETRAYERVTD